jgi:outer membrane protein assembly factor BamB
MKSGHLIAGLTLAITLTTCGQTPGTRVWDVLTGGPVFSSPALGPDGTIYVGSSDGKLWAVNTNGTTNWTFLIGPQVTASPAIGADGTIYIGSISPSNRLYAVNTNGLKKWEFATGGPLTTTPAITIEGAILFTSQDGKLRALNPDGSLSWEFSMGTQYPSSPAIAADGTIYVGSGHNDPVLLYNVGELHAIYPDGTPKWTFDARGPFSTPAIGAAGIVYVASSDNEGKVYAFDRQGHKLWELKTGASIGNSPVIATDGTIYVANRNQILWAINPNGTQKWTYNAGASQNSTVALSADGTLYIGSGNGNLYALNPSGGQIWAFPTAPGNNGDSSPVIGPGNRIYFGALSRLYAVQTAAPLANGPWPMLHHNPRHTASLQTGVLVPTVIITNPVSGSSFLPGQNIAIEARAFGGANGIASVDFLAGSNLLVRDTNSPYSVTWSNVVSGLHVLTAVVTDGSGTTNLSGEVSMLVNAPPLVSLTNPSNGAVFTARDNLLLIAAASDIDGSVAAVEFFAGTNLLGADTNGPFALAWPNVPGGTYALTARATDNWGASTTSAPVSVVANARPVISIASPADGTVISAGGSVAIDVSASDSDGIATRVDFYDGFNLLGSDASEPFSLTLNNVMAGDYTLLAQAVDNRGATALSGPVTLTAVPVNRSPVVSFDQPFEGAILIEPSSVQLVATASDTDGQIAMVEFFVDDQLFVPSATSNTYSATWSGPSPGNHLLSVKATDNLGATTSRQMRVSVVASNNVPAASLIPTNINRATLWVPDGPVNALLETNGILYVGGAFNNIGQLVPGSSVVEVSSSSPDLSYPLMNGSVHIVIGDGEGGYYVGGLFDTIGDFNRTNLAHVRADKTVDLDFRADANNHVIALAVLGDMLFVGGEFTQIGGQPRRYLAAVDKRTGTIKDWNPDPATWVSALATADNTVYIGGNFRNIGGQSRDYLAAVDATTGLAMPWNPIIDDSVDQIVIAGDRIYVVGAFRRANGVLRNGLAALDRVTGATTPFNQFEDGGAREIAVVGNTVYVGGGFTRMGGRDRNNVAAIDAQTSLATSWNPGAEGSVEAMAVLGDTLYIAGTFTQVAGQPRNRFAALNKDTGALLPLDLTASGRIFSLTGSAGKILGGGPLGLIRVPRKGLAAIDSATGFATGWDPQCDGEVFALAAKDHSLYVGGGFSQLGGQTRNSLGAVDTTTGLATLWNPGPAGGIRALTIQGDTLFVGGEFGGLGNQPRNSLAAVDLRTGDVLPWNPNASGLVRAVTVASNIVYVGGNFTQVGGQPRNRIAALNLFTGKATAWNPNANGSLVRVVAADNAIYVSGGFSRIGGAQRRSLAALDPQTGAATGWTSDVTGSVIALGVMGDLVYAGGQFTAIGGVPRTNLGAMDRRFSPPNAVDWNPKPGAESSGVHVETMEVTASTIYVGGNFMTVDGRGSPYLAAFDLPSRVESPLHLPNGLFRVNLIGPLGRTYVFEASTNLTDWIPVFTNRAPFIFEDVDAINHPQRFYRAAPLQ